MRNIIITALLLILVAFNQVLSDPSQIKWIKSGHSGAILSVNISKDGNRVISTSYDATLKIWNAGSGDLIQQFYFPYVIMNAVLLPGGDEILVSHFKDNGNSHNELTDYSLKIIDLNNGNVINTLAGHTNIINTMCITPDGNRILSVSQDSTIKFWDLHQNEIIYSIKENSQIEKVDISPDGKNFIYLKGYHLIIIRDTETGSIVDSIRTTDFSDLSFDELKYTPDGKSITAATFTYDSLGSLFNDLFIWEFENKNHFRVLNNDNVYGYHYSFSDDGKYLVFEGNIWNFEESEINQHLWYEFDGSICSQSTCTRFLPNSYYYVVGTGCGGLGLWDARSGKQVKVFTAFTDNILSVAFTNDSRSVALSVDFRLKYIDSETGDINRLFSEDYDADNMEFSTDGKYLLMSSPSIILLKDPATDRRIKRFLGDYYWLSSDELVTYGLHGRFSPDNKLIAGGSEAGNIRIWDIDSEIMVDSIYIGKPVNTIDFSSDGSKIASGDWRGFIKIWDIKSDSISLTITSGAEYINQIQFFNNDKNLVSISNDSLIRIWDCFTGNLINTLHSHTSEITSFQLVPFYHLLFTASRDGNIKIWNLNNMDLIYTFPKYNGQYKSISLSKDLNYLCAATFDASVIEWKIDLTSLSVDNQDLDNIIFNLYPNPTSDYIEIAMLNPELNPRFKSWVHENIRIYNALGEIVLNAGAIHELPLRIDVSSLPPGLYFVRLGNITRKFIKI